GVFHTAGVPAAGLMQRKAAADLAPVLAPKLEGTLVLAEVLRDPASDRSPFVVLFSSTTSVLGGGPGQVDYCAANAFLNAYAQAAARRGRPVCSIAWGEWQWNAWEASMEGLPPDLRSCFSENRERLGIDSAGGMEALERVLASRLPHCVVVSLDFLEQLRLSREYTVDRLLSVPFKADRGGVRDRAGHRPSETSGGFERRIAEIWQQILGVSKIGFSDNFFDLGGNSLIGLQVTAALQQEFGRQVLPVALYEAPTVRELARYLNPDMASEPAAEARREARHQRRQRRSEGVRGGIAIIGMAGRFPEARGVEQLWQNLLAGREAITFFSDEELLAAGVEPAMLADPRYVRAGSVLDDVDRFDAELFGISPREAELMDPQHRLFLECAWETLDDGGYDPLRYPGSIGVYGGSNLSTYLLQILARPELAAT
ncbi:MAG: KR domain-containing protein, partial [bacterium]|nr:KR domain-containing protein [bacterium]